MGYPLDITAQNAALDALLGDNAGASMPSSFEVALFTAHPLLGGTELDATGGYGRVTIANDSSVWPDASSGQKVSAIIPLAAPSGAWSDTATHYLLYDAADSTTAYLPGRLLSELAVDGTETTLAVQLAAFWNVTSL
jgi:hypothetical protein